MKQNTYLPSLIKIYCLQLQETIESSAYRRLLAICPGINKNDRNTYVYEPLTEYFIPVAVSDINQLHFEIKDEQDNFLELGVGAATYIRLQVKYTIDQGKWNLLVFLVMIK